MSEISPVLAIRANYNLLLTIDTSSVVLPEGTCAPASESKFKV